MNLSLELVPIAGLLVVAWAVNRSLLLVRAHEQVVVTSGREVVDVFEPGINVVRPFGLERTHYDMRTQTLTMGERVTTADGETIGVRVVLRFRVDDPRQLHRAVDNYRDRLADVVRRELDSVVGREHETALEEESDRVATRLTERIDREVRSWGLDVEGAEVGLQTAA